MPIKTVFISYSHDSDEHREKVLGLAERLRQDGLDARLDQYVSGTPEQGWPTWILDQLDEADFVLVVCTETYHRRFRGHEVSVGGKGVTWEGALINQEIYETRRTMRFVPIMFTAGQEPFIPEPLRRHTHYELTTEARYQALYDFLLGLAGIEPRPIGTLRPASKRVAHPLTFGPTREPPLPAATSKASQQEWSARSVPLLLAAAALAVVIALGILLVPSVSQWFKRQDEAILRPEANGEKPDSQDADEPASSNPAPPQQQDGAILRPDEADGEKPETPGTGEPANSNPSSAQRQGKEIVQPEQPGMHQEVISAMLKRSSVPASATTSSIDDGFPAVSLVGASESMALKATEGDHKQQAAFVGLRHFLEFSGATAATRTKDRRPTLELRLGKNPGRYWWIVRLDPDDDGPTRGLDLESVGVYGGVYTFEPAKDFIIESSMVDAEGGVWRFKPNKDLKPSEYSLFCEKGYAYDFGIDK